MCEQLGLTIGQSEQATKAIPSREGVTNPITEQLEKARKKAVEEFYAILFYISLIIKNMVRSLKTWKMMY